MSQPIRFCLALHNHQPVGNFDHVFEQAYQDSYLPFLDVFDRHAGLRLSLHTSGPLMEWLDEHHPEYLDRLASHVAAGRIEILGGAFYEPILTMIPSCDRVGQIRRYTRWLESRLGAQIRGMWVPERVWEQSLTADIVQAGIQFTLLDDFHFKNAGLEDQRLHGYYVTEDSGYVLNVLPGSERLRYAIPFSEPDETINYLREISEQQAGAVVVFGDDGEKFGTWPETKQHVYEHGWLDRFFTALVENQDWIQVSTLSEAVSNVPPLGKIFLPQASYREMTEWALPTSRQLEYEDLSHDLEFDPRWPTIRSFIRGGFWRNFKVKYPESDEMYARMMMVSRRLAAAAREDADSELLDSELLDAAQRELYRGQCNCSYWHGAFGGIYLPHLRNAVYKHLIKADNLLDRALGKPSTWVEATADDFNLDARQEVQLANEHLLCLVAPAAGGQLYELDVRSVCHNLLATMRRREEAYHHQVRKGATQDGQDVASIHDRVIFKQEGLDERLHYDAGPRKSLLDHFYGDDVTLESIATSSATDIGDFASGVYDARIRRNPDRVQVQMTRSGRVGDAPVRITKGLTLEAGSSTLEIVYLLEGLPRDRRLHFGVELNCAGMPAGLEDRYFYDASQQRLGQLGSRLDLADARSLGLVDEWLGIDVQISASRPAGFWAFPVETVSQSEGGFELVHQSVVVQPHWLVFGDAHGQWSVTLKLDVDTGLAKSRLESATELVSVPAT